MRSGRAVLTAGDFLFSVTHVSLLEDGDGRDDRDGAADDDLDQLIGSKLALGDFPTVDVDKPRL